MLYTATKIPLIDMHAHLRDRVGYHTNIAGHGGIDFVVAMPNTNPCLDNPDAINAYAAQESAIPFAPMGAITIRRDGKKLVDVERIAPYVVGFTDDGNCLTDMKILRDILQTEVGGERVWVMLHCGEEDPYDAWPRETTEPEWVEKALEVNRDAKGKLYIQHVSRAASVALIREARADGVPVTAETCPHYIKWTRDTMRVPVNPPIGDESDREAIREALADGTIDTIASDYAPEPRPKVTGIADWDNYGNSCRGLVSFDGLIPEARLISLTSKKPLEVIRSSSGYRAGNIKLPEWFR